MEIGTEFGENFSRDDVSCQLMKHISRSALLRIRDEKIWKEKKISITFYDGEKERREDDDVDVWKELKIEFSVHSSYPPILLFSLSLSLPLLYEE